MAETDAMNEGETPALDTSDSNLMKVAKWLTNAAIDGVGPLSSSAQLAQEYKIDADYSDDDARVDSLIKWEAAKNFATGFLTGLGGFITLPVTLPAGIGAAWAVQARLVGAIAEIYGHSIRDTRTQTAVLLCLVGGDAVAVLREAGAEVGKKFTLSLIKKIPGEVLAKINKLVGFRLITKAGEKGVINLTKMAPFVGGVISGGIDVIACRTVGALAKSVFSREARADEDAAE